jgi:hypothetical protein
MNISSSKKDNHLKTKLRQSLKALADGDLKTAREGLEWIKVNNDLQQYRNSRQKVKLSFAFMAICLILISASLELRIPAANVVSRITSKSVNFTLAKPCYSNTVISTRSVRITNLSSFDTRSKMVIDSGWLAGKSEIQFSGPEIKITEIKIDSGAEVDIDYEENILSIYVKKGKVSSCLEFSKGNILSGSDSIKIDIPENNPCERVVLNLNPDNYKPSTLVIINPKDFILRNACLTKIKFEQEDPPGSSNFISTIINGQIKFSETNQTTDLDHSDRLELVLCNSNKLGITTTESDLTIILESKITSCKIFKKEIKPNILSYLYYNSKVALIWASILFLWGLLWSVRNTMI